MALTKDVDTRLRSARSEFQQRLADIKRDLLLGVPAAKDDSRADVSSEYISAGPGPLSRDGLTPHAHELRESLGGFLEKLYPPGRVSTPRDQLHQARDLVHAAEATEAFDAEPYAPDRAPTHTQGLLARSPTPTSTGAAPGLDMDGIERVAVE